MGAMAITTITPLLTMLRNTMIGMVMAMKDITVEFFSITIFQTPYDRWNHTDDRGDSDH
jgi:hypothetical protein